jgi:hypothetical protein
VSIEGERSPAYAGTIAEEPVFRKVGGPGQWQTDVHRATVIGSVPQIF